MAKGIIWKPYGDYVEKSNIARFMKAHKIRDYDALIKRSTDDVAWFWDAALKDLGVEWYEPYEKVMDDSEGFPWTKWFIGGKINIVHNAIDRHIRDGKSNKLALIWEGDDGAVRTLTYGELNALVCKVASALTEIGVKKGDTVGIYMPMVPEIVAAFFGIMKIGAIAIPVFSGFGAAALATRLEDAQAKVLFTADGSLRRGKKVELKRDADEAVKSVPSIKHVIVLKRLSIPVQWQNGRDLWWHEFVEKQPTNVSTAILDAEDRSLLIYTSGTTGKPKGTVHTHVGCIAQMAKELGYYFDVKEDSRFFWLTDIGWMMGPWEMVGVQFFGATYMVYEGAPNYPNPDRLWEIVDRHKLTHLGISPTAIRLLRTYGEKWIDSHDLSSLKYLGSTGEPWDEDSYMWFFTKVGKSKLPVINISGGTEIVGCLLSPLPITELKPCTLRGPGLGMDVDVFDEEGKTLKKGIGYLVCKKPAPSMTKGFLNDPQRYLDTYFSKWPDIWNHGDWAERDEDGFIYLRGRADDTIKIAGKRIGPSEVEAALLEHKAVAESAAVGVPDPIKGEEVVCFVVLNPGYEISEKLREELREQVIKYLGKTVKPKEVKFVGVLPKTRSGKIVRGVIRRKHLGMPLGDIASVENPDTIEEIGNAK